MATRKELIDQVRADQRERSALTRADNPKPAIVGIGDRDPLTGQYQVLLPDGSVEMGEKQFNSSLPNGSQVLGVPQSTGGWLLDERDVHPINPIIQLSPGGKIKVLFSTIEGEERVFWVGGDLAQPKKIYAIPRNFAVNTAIVNNAGDDRFFVALSYGDSFGSGTQKITISHNKKWQFALGDAVYPTGHGFWTQAIGTSFIGTPITSVSFALVSRSQFLGNAREITGGHVSVDGIDKPYPRVESASSNNAISPKIDKLTRSFLSEDNSGSPLFRGHSVANIETRRPVLLGKGATSAIYEYFVFNRDTVSYPSTIGTRPPDEGETTSTSRDAILVNCVTRQEIKLGGELPKQFAAPTIVEFRASDNLVSSKYYRVQLTSDIFRNSHLAQIDKYQLSANSSKTDVKSKIYSIKKPSSGLPTDTNGLAALTEQLKNSLPVTIGNVTVYNASYHP